MELKVWVDGVLRVVCGMSPSTSCKDVVVALAQAIGQTGRYVLTMKLRGAERRLLADECPLQVLAQLGQLTAEVQFVLHRTGSSLSEGPSAATRPRSSEPHEHKKPNGTSSYASSIRPGTYKPNRSWSPSPRASPEPRASPVSFTHRLHHTKASSSWKEEVFRQVLQQQRRLQDLEMQLQSLERETALWEWDRSTVPAPSLTPEELQELKVLEELEEELGEELEQMEELEEQLQAAMDRERDMTTHLQQMQASLDEQSQQISELHARSEHLEQDLKTSVQSPSCRPASPQEEEEVLRPLQEQLLQRLQQTEELDVTLCETRRELRAAEERLQDRLELVEELNKELRQCKLQQFIQRSGSNPYAEPTGPRPSQVYLGNAGIVEEEPARRCASSPARSCRGGR